MTLTAADLTRLRAWIGERIPSGGSAADTNFTDVELQAYAEAHSNLYTLAAELWRLKAGWVMEAGADVVEKAVGSEKLKFVSPKDRYAHYLEMADYYDSLAPVTPETAEGSAIFEQEQPDVLGLEAIRRGDCDISRLIGYDC